MFFLATSSNSGYKISSALEIPIYAIIRGNISDANLNQIFKNSAIKGVTYYVGWSKLNPQKNNYDFSSLTKILTLAEKYNKKVNLGVLTGRWSPKWLENNKVKYLYWNHFDDYVEKGNIEESKAPIPWDKNFCQYFETFLVKLKEIVDVNQKTFNAIEITGGSNTNGIETNFICSDDELKRVEFNFLKYTNNWKKIIDNFSKLFPNIILTLAIHDSFGSQRSQESANELINYCNLKYTQRIKIAAYAFTEEEWFNRGNQYADLVLKLPSKDIVLQSIKIYSIKSTNVNFEKMLFKASEIKPAWLEIWGEDVINKFLDSEQ
ncbi:beta-galactosidase [Flavobacterium reichenbachii]|uniref:Glycoside hydrolase family 42 N-terminal domain-containing protein n=1 Tax=Flavobacterium reichenbachii TaxID=362418 RepID=A0A085ZDD0_9FLAO|nr:beta-galactosidase [Flavobacterium reichenbachii]KFF02444.1 hypothetical protein IW19_24445 [Flavobacterium reichenbachii]OXB13578.1 hypothetical protein B0A68_14605 [Flavobacterium reichenbachii]